MTKIKIENEKKPDVYEDNNDDNNEDNKEAINEEILDEVEEESFKPREIFVGGKKQMLEEIYNDETLKQIQKPPRAPIRRFFIGLVVGLLIGLALGLVIAILFLRYF